MKDANDKKVKEGDKFNQDKPVKLKECDNVEKVEWKKDFTVYCPDFDDSDFLYGDANSGKYQSYFLGLY
jgi:hypothetical protein